MNKDVKTYEKYKNAGIECFGQMPEHREAKRLKE